MKTLLKVLLGLALGGAAIDVALAGERAISEELRRGRELFFTTDRRISMGKKACASCHPDGGDDGLPVALVRELVVRRQEGLDDRLNGCTTLAPGRGQPRALVGPYVQTGQLGDAQAAADKFVADLRTERLRLRERWTCPKLPGPEARTREPDAAERDREESAGRIVRAAAECDKQVTQLQAIIRADRE